MAKKIGRPKDFPGKETTKIAGFIPKETAKKFKVFVLVSEEYTTISQALNAAIEEFLKKKS